MKELVIEDQSAADGASAGKAEVVAEPGGGLAFGGRGVGRWDEACELFLGGGLVVETLDRVEEVAVEQLRIQARKGRGL